MNTSIVTYTGKSFDYTSPDVKMVCIEDIAHALSLTCRFQGHTRKFYSVAEHCARMTYTCDDPIAALLHDSAEAYIGDIPRPQKQNLGWYTITQLTDGTSFIPFSVVENRILTIIGDSLDVSDLCKRVEKVKENDIRMCVTETQKLMPKSTEFDKWTDGHTTIDVDWPQWMQTWGWSCSEAENVFLRRYRSLRLRKEIDDE